MSSMFCSCSSDGSANFEEEQSSGVIQLVKNFLATLSRKQFLLVASTIVGMAAGFAALMLKAFVHLINVQAIHYAAGYQQFFLIALLPIVGIVLSAVYIRYILRKTLRRGSAEVVYAIGKKSSDIDPKQIPAQLITSGLTVGFGGSVGLESPMVSAGSGLGSWFGKLFKMTYKERTILVACGAAAGIAAAFNSPIAGVLFAIEVLLIEVGAAAFIPLIIAAATGALIAKVILKEGVLLSFKMQQPFEIKNVPWYLLLGLICGFLSLYYTYIHSKVERSIAHIKRPIIRVITGGIALALLLITFPPLFGEGYESIKTLGAFELSSLTRNSILLPLLDDQWIILAFLMMVMLTKVFAAAITVGTGGNGGSFGPSLFVGAYLGFAFSRAINLLQIGSIPESNFMLVAMAGILSGVFYAPLTAIFLIAEITGGYGLMIPLMIVSSISVTVARYFEPLSMEARRLSGRMKLSVDSKDSYILSKLDFSALIETDFHTIGIDDKLSHLVHAIRRSKRNVFPVTDSNGLLAGIVTLDSVRQSMFDPELYDEILIKDLMIATPAVIFPGEELHEVLAKFEATSQWSLPLVEHGKYLGFISKSSVLDRYRSELRNSM